MRLSVNASKARSRGGAPLQRRPDPESKLGQMYDRFKAAPATPIRPLPRMGGRDWSRFKNALLYEYGLDIRPVLSRPGWWWLVGEDDEKGRYIDHLAARIAALDQKGE